MAVGGERADRTGRTELDGPNWTDRTGPTECNRESESPEERLRFGQNRLTRLAIRTRSSDLDLKPHEAGLGQTVSNYSVIFEFKSNTIAAIVQQV